MRTSHFAFYLLPLALVACNDRDRPSGGDSGPADAATADGPTSGDASTDAGAADAGPMCTPEILEPFPGRPCPTSVRTCTEACTNSDCVGACIEAAPVGDCSFCLDLAIITCINRNGCQEPWNCFRECIRTECASDPSDACIVANCREVDDAYAACITDERVEICGTRYLDCVME